MTLIRKTLLIFLSVFIIMFIGIGLYMNNTILNVFHDLEYNHFIKMGTQIVKSIDNRISYYEAFLSDWANWDDSYEFVEDLNHEYIESNLLENVLDQIGITSMIFLDKEMNTVYQLTGRHKVKEVNALIEQFSFHKEQLMQTALTRKMDFFLQTSLKDNFMCVVAPINQSSGEGPYHGFMILAVLFDDKLVEKLSEITGLTLTINNDTTYTHWASDKVNHVTENIASDIHFSDHNTVFQDFFFFDMDNNCVITTRMEQDRVFNIQMMNVLKDARYFIAIVGLSAIVIVLIILDRFVLSELRNKVKRFKEIEMNNDLSLRLDETTGTKEMIDLSKAANGALSKIENLNNEIIKMSNMDNLTKLANRKHFDEQFIIQYKSAVRKSTNISILMIDIDFFKKYNDSYGHLCGDSCLKHVAEIISKSISRPEDLAARYGGEEFIVMLPDTDIAGALHIAEEMRKKVELSGLPHKASECSSVVTISIGAAAVVPTNILESISLISEADKALYSAKLAGRNQVKSI